MNLRKNVAALISEILIIGLCGIGVPLLFAQDSFTTQPITQSGTTATPTTSTSTSTTSTTTVEGTTATSTTTQSSTSEPSLEFVAAEGTSVTTTTSTESTQPALETVALTSDTEPEGNPTSTITQPNPGFEDTPIPLPRPKLGEDISLKGVTIVIKWKNGKTLTVKGANLVCTSRLGDGENNKGDLITECSFDSNLASGTILDDGTVIDVQEFTIPY